MFLFLPKIEKREYSVTNSQFLGQNFINFGRLFFVVCDKFGHFDSHLNFGVVFSHQFFTAPTFFYKHFSPIDFMFCLGLSVFFLGRYFAKF